MDRFARLLTISLLFVSACDDSSLESDVARESVATAPSLLPPLDPPGVRAMTANQEMVRLTTSARLLVIREGKILVDQMAIKRVDGPYVQSVWVAMTDDGVTLGGPAYVVSLQADPAPA